MAKTKVQTLPEEGMRQPIVAILGHVDHGKTSLLDYIRTTHLAAKEAGGITQSIGAYEAKFQDRKITFIDTPGHAAFSKMRGRGASAADVAVLVVAADDGVKPQTIESIKHIKDSGIPFIVAINKIDKPGVVPDTVKAQLTEHQVFVEGYGGNTPVVLISAKSGQGVASLLENLLLLADLEELRGDAGGQLEAQIIEANKDRKKGNLVSAIVKNGTLKSADTVYYHGNSIKIKALYNDLGLPLASAGPGMPVQILGFSSLPQVGELITSQPAADQSASDQSQTNIEASPPTHKLNLILKANTLGSLEAVKGNLAPEINLVLVGTGDINESDVLLAATTGALILGFGVKAIPSALRLAETEGVKLKNFPIIYDLLEYLEKKVLRLLEPTIDEEELGFAKILKLFEINGEVIAGSLVESGEINQGDTVRIEKRDGEHKYAKVKSLRIGKQELKKVEAGKECGILLFPRLDMSEKDVIISYKKLKTDED